MREKLALVGLLFVVGACGPNAVAGGDAGGQDSAPSDAQSAQEASVTADGSSGTDATAGDGGGAPDGTTGGDAGADAAPLETHTFRVNIGPIALPAGGEWTQCVVVPMGNATEQMVRSVRAHLGSGSHHLIVYRSTDTMPNTTPTPCRGFSGITESYLSPQSPMLIAQQAEAALNWPDGVGMHVDANQLIRLEFHAINLTSSPVMATAAVDIDAVDVTARYTPGDTMFWGNTRISIPAHSTGAVEFFSVPRTGTRVFALTSHTHQFGAAPANTIHLGTAGSTMMVPGVAGVQATVYNNITDGQMLHRSTNWSDPPLTVLPSPLVFDGTQGMHLRCNYNNTSASTVGFGESANQEMCFMWAYYYPAPRGLNVCVQGYTGQGVVCFPF